MKPHLTFQQAARIAAVGFFVAIMGFAAFLSRRGEEVTVIAPLERGQADALASTLAHCRSVMPDQTAAVESCRHAWAEHRRHFFRPSRPPQPPIELNRQAPPGTASNNNLAPKGEAQHPHGEVP